jgi:hypothetical protein
LIQDNTHCHGTLLPELAIVHQSYPCGMVNIVLCAQLELSSMQRKDNVITAPTDSSEIITVHHAFRAFDYDRFIELICLKLFCCLNIFKNSKKAPCCFDYCRNKLKFGRSFLPMDCKKLKTNEEYDNLSSAF